MCDPTNKPTTSDRAALHALHALLAAILLVAVSGCEGATGTEGPAGKDGAEGAIGAAGATGQRGPKGDAGKDAIDGKKGDKGETGDKGATGDKGESGDVASAKGKLTGTVLSSLDSKGLSDVTVTAEPGAHTAKTDNQGAFDLGDLAIGAYTVTLAHGGFATQKLTGVGVVALTTTKLTATLLADPTVGAPPTVVVTDQLLAGFSAKVTLAATAADADGDVKDLTYKWQQVVGPTLVVAGADTASLEVTTVALDAQKSVQQARFGVLALQALEVGRAVFEVTVTDKDNHSVKATAMVQALPPTLGLANVPVGLPVYLAGDADQKSWDWQLDSSGVNGTKASLTNEKTRFPSFVADAQGPFKLTETVSGNKITVHAGNWSGVVGAYENCKVCHDGSIAPKVFEQWQVSKHAAAFGKGLDGAKGDSFSTACFECHTVGSSPLTNNGGFDDVNTTTSKWVFTKPAAGTWDKLQTDKKELAKLGGVQCESCHGPQASGGHSKRSPRVSWDAAVCATCHQKAPSYTAPEQWRTSKHANLDRALDMATWERNGKDAADCGRCHSAQGFAMYAEQLAAGNSGVLTQADGAAADETWLRAKGLQLADVQPPTCAACHDPHGNDAPASLRVHDSIKELPNGLANITGAGSGATCMACHNGRLGEHTDFAAAPTKYDAAPPPSETDVLFGFNAWFVPRMTPSVHLAVKDTCAGCHVAGPMAADGGKPASDHTFAIKQGICADCHSANVDGKGLQGAVTAQLNDLAALIGKRVAGEIDKAIKASGKVQVRGWDAKTKLFTSAAGANIELTDAPTAAEPVSIGLQAGWRLKLAKATEIAWTDGSKTTVDVLDVTAADLSAAGKPLMAPDHMLLKAAWNVGTLRADGSGGVHNPAFYQAVIAGTHTAIK